jgi:hypothetical protein
MGAIANESLLKRKQTYLEKVEAQIQAAKVELAIASDTMKKLETIQNKLVLEIQQLKAQSKDLIVSEHAILRYLERIRGINMDEIRNEIAGAELRNQVKVLGNGTYPIGGGAKAIVKNNVVVTVEA